MLNRALVRDGKPYPPADLSQLEILAGVPEACRLLRERGFLLIVVTNQPDIARGTQKAGTVDAINDYLQRELRLDAIRICPHDDADACACRKPRPGLLLQAAEDFDISLSGSWMVGDRWRDIEAGRRAGCPTVWIRYPYQERQPEQFDYSAPSLREAVALLQKDNIL